MSISPQALHAMGLELAKLGSVPEERLTKARRKQMLKDGIVTVGSMGVGWGVGKTVSDAVGDRALKDPKFRKAVKRFGPKAMALVGAGTGLALAKQRRVLKERREAAEAAAGKKAPRVQ